MRYLAAILAAAGITIGLFYLMQSLISGGEGAMSEPVRGSVLDFVRTPEPEQVQEKERKPERPPEPEQPPEDLPQPQMDTNVEADTGAGYDFSANVDAAADIGNGASLQASDGEYLPIVKVQATYPRRALQRGIEGYVVVEFTVTRQGTVRDPVVVQAEPEGIFEQSALDAVMKFKYKPRVIDGEPVEVEGVQNRMTFEMN
ncbi:MAG: protein TonB [Idiomarina sp.]|jgi:protein TonB|uniref:Protein TonB n=1 Tax=Idiomarina aquatica TaxID=1327752 RepID=A0A4R6PLV6_9GAMM|nr:MULTISPECIES: energy transducer TonB [Idiomarina]MAK71127.1 protein TonB [Idiomarinaceae bacterium]MBL4742412.1 energy transducer TonB [Idiomarina sp.]MBT42011.1 protein TonB [Idiomarina sp.]PHQ76965.1 MAG: protein TonB [Idiomarina sp.]TDP39204.1 outer membrane transport energization protein TonB [Idiomarina aquatica]